MTATLGARRTFSFVLAFLASASAGFAQAPYERSFTAFLGRPGGGGVPLEQPSWS